MKRLLFVFVIVAFFTGNLNAQKRIFFGYSENSVGFKYFPGNDYEKIHVSFDGNECDLRGDGLHLSWVGGPSDPRGRFIIGGGEGSVTIDFDPPIWISNILVECDDLSFKQFSPGLQMIAIVNLGEYIGTKTLTGVIRDGNKQNTSNFWNDLQTSVVLRISGGVNLERLTLRTYGYGDFVIHGVIFPF